MLFILSPSWLAPVPYGIDIYQLLSDFGLIARLIFHLCLLILVPSPLFWRSLVLWSSICWGRSRVWAALLPARSIWSLIDSCPFSCGIGWSSLMLIPFRRSPLGLSFLSRRKKQYFQRFSMLLGCCLIWVISPQLIFFCVILPPFTRVTYWNNSFLMWNCKPSRSIAQSEVSVPFDGVSYSLKNLSRMWTSPCLCTRSQPPMLASCVWWILSAFWRLSNHRDSFYGSWAAPAFRSLTTNRSRNIRLRTLPLCFSWWILMNNIPRRRNLVWQ